MKKLLFLLLIALGSLTALEKELLSENDIQKIMKQILDNHLGEKNLTSRIWQSAIKNYINQFDVSHAYLLASEVGPYLNLSEQRLNEIDKDYRKNDFKIFYELNDLFQKSIYRSREIREKIENRSVFQGLIPEYYDVGTFANTIEELRERQINLLFSYIEQQHRQYGNATVNKSPSPAILIKSYEESTRSFENQYLFVDESGNPLPKDEKTNLQTIHILKALAGSLDSHTTFYNATEAYDIKTRLMKQVNGVGIEVKESPNGFIVSNIIPESPAEKSQVIKVGDILKKIDGRNVTGLTLDEVVQILHHCATKVVQFVLAHPSTPETTYSVKLDCTVIPINSDRVDVRYQPFGSGIIGILTLHSFYQNDDGVSSADDLNKAINDLQKKGTLKGLILDLRDNSGGFLSQAVKVAGLFIKGGVIVISKYSNGEQKYYRDVDGKTSFSGPLIVLVSKITASAAEIVAQSLQDYGVALIVGDEHTYGKGTIQMQTVTDNIGGSYFKVTVGKYYTVSGRTPQKKGVMADIIVPGHWNDINVGEEFLNSEPADSIDPTFTDPLTDINKSEKAWYMKYYVPNEQKPVDTWRKLLPPLKKNSERRISSNKNYQYYLHNTTDDDPDEDQEWTSGPQKNYGEDNLQLQEAINILKDMILIHSKNERNGSENQESKEAA